MINKILQFFYKPKPLSLIEKERFINFYQKEILNQIEFYLICIENLNQSDNPAKTFCYIHNSLSHSSNVDKLLRERNLKSNKNNESNYINLRNSYTNWIKSKFDQYKIIKKNTRPRNHLEHFDERLLTFFSQTSGTIIVDMNIGSRGNIVIGNQDLLDSKSFLRNFDPQNKEFIWRGEKYNLQDLTNSIIELKNFLENNEFKIES